jgi:phage terminase large subunit-like protein
MMDLLMTSSSARLATDAAVEAVDRLDDVAIAALARAHSERAAKELVAWAKKTAPEGYEFDEFAAARACAFFPRYLRHTKGTWFGRPFELYPLQEAIVRTLFGWKRPDGSRRFRITYVEEPRKNGKTGLAAGLGLFLLTADGELGAEVYSFANDTDQAAIAHDTAKAMRMQSPQLKAQTLAYKRAIVAPRTQGSYRVLSSDAGTKHGLNAHGLIGDELHEFRDRHLYDALHTSTGARRQPLEFLITTAGYDRNSFCYTMHDYALKVRDGILEDPEFLPVIVAADEDDDFTDPRTWAKANPGLGVTISVGYLRKEAEKASAIPAYENTFRRLHLNQWTEQSSRWLPMDRWDACGEIPLDLDALEGRACWAGLDLSTTTDISALELVFRDEEGIFKALSFFWVPAENLRRRAERDRVPYDQWAREGFIESTEGNVVDYDVIRARINELGKRYEIRELAIDRWNSTQLQTQLMGDGFTVVPFGQGFGSMTAPSKELEALVLDSRLAHGGNPVLRWMAANTAVKQDPAGNLKPAKDKSAERIDGIVALVMALGRATVATKPSEDLASALKRRGVLALGGAA